MTQTSVKKYLFKIFMTYDFRSKTILVGGPEIVKNHLFMKNTEAGSTVVLSVILILCIFNTKFTYYHIYFAVILATKSNLINIAKSTGIKSS